LAKVQKISLLIAELQENGSGLGFGDSRSPIARDVPSERHIFAVEPLTLCLPYVAIADSVRVELTHGLADVSLSKLQFSESRSCRQRAIILDL
jgi:hypothetical protein